MPSAARGTGRLDQVAQSIVQAGSDGDYLDQLIAAIKGASKTSQNYQLLQSLTQYSDGRETEIERICSTSHEDFAASVNKLLDVREGTVALASEVFTLNEAIQSSTEKLAEQKRALVEARGIRQNIDEAGEALKDCIEVLKLANTVHELLDRKSHYAALRSLDELQNVHLREVAQYKIADMIQKSVPATKRAIAEAVMNDLNTWLYRIRETSQFLGEVAFYATEQRMSRQKARAEQASFLEGYGLNSAVELVADEDVEFDVLDNDDVSVDFTPLHEAMHIHEALGQSDKFRQEYAATRRQQKELLMSTQISLADPEESSLSELLEGIAGFAIVERATMKRAPGLRSAIDVDELWSSMCQSALAMVSKALTDVNNAELLLKIKTVIALFIQTMESWGYPVRSLDAFLLTLFEHYAELLKLRFSDDFHEIVSTDDYMPMPINNAEEYKKVINVSWYTPDKPQDELRFPCVLPFSQMYPLCCIDIRNFLNQFYTFSDDHFEHPEVIDETLQRSLDELLSEKVCKSLVEGLSTQYLGQIVQTLINLEHFEIACRELEQVLMEARSSKSVGARVVLRATEQFGSHKKTAEKRIFELVNSKIDDLIETAEYDWVAPTPNHEPSSYMTTLTHFLESNMSTVLVGLPTEIKELIYFDALSHAATMILALPLSAEVTQINRNGVASLALDVQHLSAFVDKLNNPALQQNLDELKQTVALMQSENTDEYYDVSLRNRKYGRVDAMNGPLLLEKMTNSVPTAQSKFSAFSSRLGYR